MKKLKAKTQAAILIAGLGLITLNGCRKDEKFDDVTDVSPADITTTTNVSETERMGTDVENTADQAYSMKIANNPTQTPQNTFAPCATVTLDTTVFPSHMVIDFGTGCLGLDGRYKSGQIIVDFTGHYFDAGSVRTITFNNYYVDSNHVEGTRIVTNNGINASGNMSWSIDAQNMTVTKPDGSFHIWNSQRTREIIAGFSTQTIYDDVYLITGSFNGTDANGNAFIANITTPLRKEVGCHWMVTGVIQITKTNKPLKTLDFGNGSCDQYATVTVNGHVKTITLH